MFITNIVIDGFKSYGHRTEIKGFDERFNAITGLNGSGKSNILDAICFVLGISNLAQVRAGNLQDLIYRNGQAGINKATVSITFDNTNPSQCPPGFEDHKEITVTRQIVMGGKTKYFINGITVTNKKVQDLFCSIQLNVNNPNFLIMQGKVTKVINMKPQEILAMVEEAAGTRMLEVKRLEAQKLIDKKEAKLLEVTNIMSEELAPKLLKLREERQQFLEFQQLEKKVDRLMGLYQCWQYCNLRQLTENAENAFKNGTNEINNLEADIEKNLTSVEKLEEEITVISKNAKSDDAQKLQELESQLKEKETTEAKSNAALKSFQDNINSEERKKLQLQKHLKDDTSNLQKKQQELQNVQALFESLKENDSKDSENFEKCQKKFEAISVGMEINEEGQSQTLQDQLIKVKELGSKASTEVKQAGMRLKFCEGQLKEKEKELKTNSSNQDDGRKVLEQKENEVKVLQTKMNKLNFSEEKMGSHQEKRRILNQEIQKLREKVENFVGRRPYVNFHYTDPEPNFNRNSVKNTVCRLFEVIDPKNSIALETVAGGRLYNVVIDTEVTGKKLLKSGNLRQRTTFIPLNKIQANQMDRRVVEFAQNLVGADNCQPALSLIKYDKSVEKAMQFIFGNAFICKDLKTAKTVTFHERIKKRCVTLDGDVTDPSGTLSGGAAIKSDSVLMQLLATKESETQLHVKEQELSGIEREFQKMRDSYEIYSTTKQQLDLACHELNLVKQRLQQTKYHMQKEEVDKLKAEIETLRETIKTCKTTETECTNKAKDIEEKLKDSKSYKEKQLKETQKEMKMLKQKADESRKKWKDKEQYYEQLKMEITALEKDLEVNQQQIEVAAEMISNLKEEYNQKTSNAADMKESIEQLRNEVKAMKAIIAEKNKDVKRRNDQKEQLLAKNNDMKLRIKELNHDLKNLENNYKQAEKREKEQRKKIKANDPNLKKAEELSHKEGSDLEHKIKSCQERKTKLSRIVNTKAQNILDIEEKHYDELNKKGKSLMKDREKLLNTLRDMEKQKKQALKLAYEQITKDFGSIFGTILPRSDAKLVPIISGNNIKGLEIKVALGGIWKENLSELSGGQKSLAALSLILAMLVFKPAPLYILDEVDAALDLSHTQNIGNIVRTHFKKSQFVIVSLKDGMFNNANVLFRTKFVDGNSAITRTTRQA